MYFILQDLSLKLLSTKAISLSAPLNSMFSAIRDLDIEIEKKNTVTLAGKWFLTQDFKIEANMQQPLSGHLENPLLS